MAVRVLLLMALTGLFAAAWNSDGPAPANSLRASAIRASESQTVAAEHRHELLVSEVSQTITISPKLDLSAVALPELIAPGTYRVVDAQGRAGWVTIPADDRSAFATDGPQPFYTSQSASGRWYFFIRVDAIPVENASVSRKALAAGR